MKFTFTEFSLPYFASAAVCLVVLYASAVAWSASTPGKRPFLLLLAAAAVWNLGNGIETLSLGAQAKLFWRVLSNLGTVNVAPLYLVFALQFGGLRARMKRGWLALLWTPALLTMVVAATNPWHGLLWSSIEPSPIAGSNLFVFRRGPWYWVSFAYYFAAVLGGTAFLLRSFINAEKVYRSQILTIALASLLPWAGAILYSFDVNPWPGVNLIAVSFSLTGLAISLGMSRFQLFDLAPVARNLVIDGMSEAVLVLDGRDRIIDSNPALKKLVGLGAEAAGRTLSDALPEWADYIKTAGTNGCKPCPCEGSVDREIEFTISPLADRHGRSSGKIVMLRDITERRRAERERERLIAEISAALADVKALRGLLPICASCKKIRDDGGYWQQLEHYIEGHSTASFSHGLCPDCIGKYNPDLNKDGPG